MLSSFNNNNNNSSSSHDPDEDQPSPSSSTPPAAAASDLHFQHLMAAAASSPPLLPPPPPPPPHTLLPSSSSTSPIHLRQLLARCADLITSSSSSSDHAAAHRLVAALSAASSPFGDSTQRLAHHFAAAFSHRLLHTTPEEPDTAAMQSCYLSLNQITPFLRFAHLTANQAILESMSATTAAIIHIVDFDVMHGVQWPPLMQALSQRRPPPPLLRITGAGRDPNTLHRTGSRLATFALSLGLNFQFHPLLLLSSTSASASSVNVVNGEALAVNCMFYLNRLLVDHREGEEEEEECLRVFLGSVKGMRPRVVTVGEREMEGRGSEVAEYYGAVFESLEETVAPGSGERAAVEGGWFGREIREAVGGGGGSRSRRMEWWGKVMRREGFRSVGLSAFAISQAKLLLRLHYPCEGYRLQVVKKGRDDDGEEEEEEEEEDEDEDHVRGLLLGWRDRPLFSFSSWR